MIASSPVTRHNPGSTATDPFRSTRATAVSLAAVIMVALVFLLRPDVDLHVASWFAVGQDRFVGQTPLGEALRRLFSWIPFAVFGLLVALCGLRRLGLGRLWGPSGLGVVFMATSLGLGPGLLVNTLLKDHSHRPRPYQVDVFGGDAPFRPFYRFDGACGRNCSFVSGEGSTGFWTVAPALLIPPPWRAVAVGAAIAFGTATSVLRMAFGGHFLSDSLFAGLFTWLVMLLCWRVVSRVSGRSPAAEVNRPGGREP